MFYIVLYVCGTDKQYINHQCIMMYEDTWTQLKYNNNYNKIIIYTNKQACFCKKNFLKCVVCMCVEFKFYLFCCV